MPSRNSRAAAASASSILDSANPTWISTHSPGTTVSFSSSPMLMTRRTPLTLTLARSGWSARISITSPEIPRHMRPLLCDEAMVSTGLIRAGENVEHDPDRIIYGRGDRFAKADAVVHAARLAPHHDHLPGAGIKHAEHAEDDVGLHAVRVEQGVSGEIRLMADRFRAVDVGLDHIDRAGLTAARCCIDHDRGVVAVGEVVGEVHAPDPVVDHPRPIRQVGSCQPPRDLDSESIVAEEYVANAGDEHAGGHDATSSGSERGGSDSISACWHNSHR